MGPVRLLGLIGVVVIGASFALPASAAPGSLASAKKRATQLSAQIEAQGERLSIADERYNEASYRRDQLDTGVKQAKTAAAAAEKRWAALRRRLDQHVKTLYMHPGAPFAAWLLLKHITHRRH